MVKPIPIFEFAIAAYATTARGGDGAGKRLRDSQVERRRQFETSVRSSAPRGGALLVKINVMENAGAVTACLTPYKSVQVVQEIWLGHIEETANGYSGVVCMAQAPLRHVGWGRRIDFDPTHILDWTISLNTRPECSALHERSASATGSHDPCQVCGFVDEARC
jgi:uncharacterized protein YegJ (DUF2314 family)